MKLNVRVRYFGSASDQAGVSDEYLELPEGSDLHLLKLTVADLHRDIANRINNLLYAVNQNYAAENATLKDGDEVAIFPAVSGG